MPDGSTPIARDAREKAYSTPLEEFHVGDPELFITDSHWPWFERLRAEEPVHYCRESEFGPYWSVTKYNDIMAVDTNHGVFSSESALGGITIRDARPDHRRPIHRHGPAQARRPAQDGQPDRLAGQPASHGADHPRARRQDPRRLPIGEPFDWVDKVSIELTTQMLATLFDFPFEERRKLTRWSDVATTRPAAAVEPRSRAPGEAELMLPRLFHRLWNERVNAEPGRPDLDAGPRRGHPEHDRMEYLGNVILLIVGGNDTTRNSISGGLLALNQNPDQYAKLRAKPRPDPSMVSETIRWQTPLAHMRRTATPTSSSAARPSRKGDKVVMWYVSGNRDER
jgi:cytochrome P450